MGLFSFVRRRGLASQAGPASCCAELGRSVVAMRLRGEQVPGECVQVVFSEGGQARRAAAAGARSGEVAYGFHPGPYGVDLTPFAAAPEIGLRTRFVIDAADPRVTQQRFDLYLFSEVPEILTLAALQASLEAAVQEALAQGMLDLPPCTSLDEWNGFRAGLNQLLYTRFGVTVEDCLPVELGEQADYAAQLRSRALAQVPEPEPASMAANRSGADAAAAGAQRTSVANPAAPPDESTRKATAPVPASASTAPGQAGATAAAPAPASSATTGQAGAGIAEPPPARAATLGQAGATAAAATPASSATTGQAGAAAVAPSPAGAATAGHAAVTSAAAPVYGSAAQARDGAAGAVRGQPDIAGTADDAHALRRLFLELPALSGGLRQVALPPGQPLFLAHRSLLQRIALIALEVNTMPALDLAAPGQPLPAAQQQRRARHSLQAARELDQAWALLARLQLAANPLQFGAACGNAGLEPILIGLLDDADRIVSNLDYHLAQRRTASVDAVPAGKPEADLRREPSL